MVDQKTQEMLMRIEQWLSQKHELSKSKTIRENHVVVLVNDHQYGPLNSKDLTELSKFEPASLNIVLFREDSELPWSLLAEHPIFNRRQGSGSSSKTILDSNEFYQLKNGIKQGPYKFQVLEEMMAAKEINYTDYISLDNGHSWVYLYQLERFDRRDQNSEDLPHLPKLEIFDQSEIDAYENRYEREVDEDLSVMTQLIQKQDNTKAPVSEKAMPFHMTSKKWGAIASIFVVAGLMFIFSGPSKKERTPASQDVQATNESKQEIQQADANGPIKNTKSKRAFERRPPTTFRSGKSKSFTESDAYKESQERLGEHMREESEDTAEVEESDPYEYDPVRSKVSKETMDRMNDNENIDDLDRAPASEVTPWPAAEENPSQDIEEAEAIDF